MEDVIRIINKLENTSSTNDKVSIIKQNENNEDFTKILYYTYNDSLQYGFSEKKLRELLKNYLENSTYYIGHLWNTGFEMLDILSKLNIMIA